MSKIILNNVRLSFPSLFEKASFDGVLGKYECSFLLSKKDTETKAKIDEILNDLTDGDNIKVNSDKIAIKDGDALEYDDYKGHWLIKCTNAKRPIVVGRDKGVITEDDGIIYGGCYANASVSFWLQNNKYGKRINGNLHAVQFVKDGDSFGAGDAGGADDFDDLDDL